MMEQNLKGLPMRNERTEEAAIEALHQAGFRQMKYTSASRIGQATDFTDTGMYIKGEFPNVVCAGLQYSPEMHDPFYVCHRYGKATVQRQVFINKHWDLVGELLKIERELLA